jgi:rfaE bifunctional protein kinase chain/domain/rfaE bifunctional protein nucleotidyltransferase chain/domain
MINKDKINLINSLNKIRKKNKKIVLCHGVFDLVHLGHIKHFKSAKSHGDYLVVSITVDKFIKKGPGRPLFNEAQRLEFLRQIKLIDKVILSKTSSAEDVIKLVKPNYYVKGPDYLENKNDKTKKIFSEKKLVESFGGKIIYTKDQSFSSSKIINSNNFIFDEDQKKFIRKIKKKFTYSEISKMIDKFKKLNIFVLGELIIDKYCFGNVIGKSGKEPHLVLKENKTEYYLGGSAAVARHISSFVNKVDILSPFGFEKYYNKIIKQNFSNNIKKNFFKPYLDYQTITKTRFVDKISGYKLFGSYVLPEKLEVNFEQYVKKIIQKKKNKIDMFIVCDYGHNFISKNIAIEVMKSKKMISLNAQVNSANIGYHSINKYNGISSLIINENELRQELRDNKSDLQSLTKKIMLEKNIKNIIVTCGTLGAILVNEKFKVFKCPAFAKKTIDKVGAGDTMLAIASMGFKLKLDPELILFMSSLAASISVESIGNKESVTVEKIDRMMEYVLK